MCLCIVRLQPDGDSTFFDGSVEITNAVKSLGQCQAVTCLMRRQPDRATRFSETSGCISWFDELVIGPSLFITDGFGRRRWTLEWSERSRIVRPLSK
jgi:hypothetical protein